jgi:L-aminopeptidase/D-esterase-like protein
MALTDVPPDRLLAAIQEGEAASALELINLASSRDVSIRESVAARPDAPISALIALAQDRKASVRLALAANSAVARAESVQGMLAADKDGDVAIALASNPVTPAATLRRLLDHGKKSVRLVAQERLNRFL